MHTQSKTLAHEKGQSHIFLLKCLHLPIYRPEFFTVNLDKNYT